MEEIKKGARNIGKYYHANGDIVSTGNGKNNNSVGDKNKQSKGDCFNQRSFVVFVKCHKFFLFIGAISGAAFSCGQLNLLLPCGYHAR